MNQFGRSGIGNIPGVVKNLIILNVIVFISLNVLFKEYFNFFALHFIFSDQFHPVQLVSHMFMHGNLTHLFFNMFGLWMFGSVLETRWGPQRFLSFFLITGLGAATLYIFANYIHFVSISKDLIPEQISAVKNAVSTISGYEYQYFEGQSKIVIQNTFEIISSSCVGASGALYGVFVAFGMLFPNTELMLLFFPVPVKAKYFIPIMIVLELFMGVGNFQWDNIAHFAHLGGALFGFIMVKLWNKDRSNFY